MADRARFGAWVAFVLVWTPAVYVPVAHWVVGFRAGEEEERTGLDLTVHAETAYDHGVLTHGMSGGAAQGSAAARLAASAAEDRSPLR